jgi:tetratricopeptide (TPR) repeat protein
MRTRWCAVLVVVWLLGPVAVEGQAGGGAVAGAKTAVEARRYEEARRALEPWVEANAGDAAAAYWLGRALFGLGRHEDAIEPLETAAELAPRVADHHFWLGRAYGRVALTASLLRQASLASKMKAATEQAIALDPGNLDARDDLIRFYLVAPSFMGGDVEEARRQAAEIARRDAARGAIARATIAMDQDDAAGAVRELEQAAAKTGDVRVRMALGSTLQSQEKWDAAFAVYDAILAAQPDHWDALYQVGRAAALSGKRLDRAEAALRRYLGHTPGAESPPLANAHYRLGMVLERKGDRPGAKAAYQAALRLDPKLQDAQEALAKLG